MKNTKKNTGNRIDYLKGLGLNDSEITEAMKRGKKELEPFEYIQAVLEMAFFTDDAALVGRVVKVFHELGLQEHLFTAARTANPRMTETNWANWLQRARYATN